MPLSRNQSSQAFKHILEQVFGLEATSPLRVASKEEGTENLSDFLSLTADTIEQLTYTYKDGDGNDVTVPVPRSHRRIITVFFDYIRYHDYKSNPIGDEWTSITKEEFDDFRISTEYLNARQGYGDTAYFGSSAMVVPLVSKALPVGSTSKTIPSKANLKQGIKKKVLDSESHKVIHRSLCRPVQPDALNLCLDQSGGETASSRPLIKSKTFDGRTIEETIQDSSQLEIDTPVSPVQVSPHGNVLVSLEDLVGTTFLMDPDLDGQCFQARVIEMIDQHDYTLEKDPKRIRFLCKLDQDDREELLTYNQVLEYLNQNDVNPVIWKYKWIVSHQGPLKPGDTGYNGSIYNVMLEWEGGEISSEPLSVIAKDDPVTCAIYAKDNNLLDTEGWKQFKSIACRQE
eukprot:scaffold1638_cov103-Amphora_coffeaeformis.AAC.2